MAASVAQQKALHNWIVACTGVPASKVIWGRQQGPRTTQPGIVLKLAFVGDDERPWVDTETRLLAIAPLTVTSDGTVFNSVAAHGRATGDGPFYLVGADLPGGTFAVTKYWLVVLSATSFKVATSFQRAKAAVPTPVTLTDAGSGAMTLESMGETVAAGAEINFVQRSLIKAILTVECFAGIGVGLDTAEATLWRINAKRLLPTPLAILQTANIGIIQVERVRALQGSQDLVLFEPRAFVDIMFHITSEETESGTIIERTDITNEDTFNGFTVGID